MANKNDLFAETVTRLDYWVNLSCSALTSANSNLAWTENPNAFEELQPALAGKSEEVSKVLSDCLYGFMRAYFTSLDGGTALADKGRVFLVNSEGEVLADSLHDDFTAYLLKAGKIL